MQRYALQIVRGDEKTLQIQWKTRNTEQPIDLTGMSVVWKIGSITATPTDYLLVEWKVGKIFLSLPPTVTRTMSGNEHQLQIVSPTTRTLLRGRVEYR